MSTALAPRGVPSLDERIAEALRGAESDPHVLALQIEGELSRVERRAMLLAGLADRIAERIRLMRSADSAIDSYGDQQTRQIEAQRQWREVTDDEFLATANAHGGQNYTQLARIYGVSTATVKKRCLRLGTLWARQMEDIGARCMASLSEAIAEAAREFEDVVLRRAQVRTQRVCVGGEWKCLADCSLADVRWLRDERQHLAADVVRAGGYYEAVYDRMVAAGARTVDDICVD